MAVFLIIPTKQPNSLKQVIEDKFPDDHYELPMGELAVSFNGTSRTLSDMLGVSDGSTGHAVIVNVSSYYGRAPADFWEWLNLKMEGR